jgi:peptidyl-prolyl cis-trans isomerase B (cyclophilin B)
MPGSPSARHQDPKPGGDGRCEPGCEPGGAWGCWERRTLLIAVTRETEGQGERPRAVIVVEKGGEIRIERFPEDAPKTVESFFITLSKKGFADGLAFHGVIPGFVAQGGDPKEDGTAGPGYTQRAEFNQRRHVRGTMAMARSQHPDSAGSQFDGPTPHLDGKYSIFAQVVSAMEVVDQIRVGDRMRTVRIEEAPKS